MDRVPLSAADLETALAVWLATAGIDQPASIRDLWTRGTEQRDAARRERARDALAHYLVGKITASEFVVTRLADDHRHHPMGRVGEP